MKLKLLYNFLSLCIYLNLFKFSFTLKSFYYAKILIHGMIFLDGQINCKKVSESWNEDITHQNLCNFLNHGRMDLELVSNNRINHLLPLAIENANNQDILSDYVLFSIDPSEFKKYKNKKTQGVSYSGDGKSTYKVQNMVMSSLIFGESCIPFKKILYWGKKNAPKNRLQSKIEIFSKLSRKAEKVNLLSKKKIIVFDGLGCNKSLLPKFHNKEEWVGFVTKFPRSRNIVIGENTIHIKKYLSNLTAFNFQKDKEKDIYYHEFEASVPSLDFLGVCKFIVVIDKLSDLKNQKTIRVLITNIMTLSSEQIRLIYFRRWKQETYHQIIKDRLGLRNYKHRKLKAVMRLLELGDLAYSYLEYQRLLNWNYSISETRNSLIDKYANFISNKFGLKSPKPLQKVA